MCEIVCVCGGERAFSGCVVSPVSCVRRRTERVVLGLLEIVVLCSKAQGRALNDSQKTESLTSASAIQPGALVGEFFLCVFIEVCIERAQKL